MLNELIQKDLIETGRKFTMGYRLDDLYNEDFVSDQDQKLPQPPLTKAPMRPAASAISLPREFESLTTASLTDLLLARKSNRVYTQEPMSLLQLSYLLWATQGIKDIRGKAYATIRTVPFSVSAIIAPRPFLIFFINKSYCSNNTAALSFIKKPLHKNVLFIL